MTCMLSGESFALCLYVFISTDVVWDENKISFGVPDCCEKG